MKFIKAILTFFLSLFLTFCTVVFLGMAVGFWFWFAKAGFDAATQLLSNFL